MSMGTPQTPFAARVICTLIPAQFLLVLLTVKFGDYCVRVWIFIAKPARCR